MVSAQEKKRIVRPNSRKNTLNRLDTVLRTRCHGAYNIRGIRYQILYSILRAFDLFSGDERTVSIRLEGIEDIDLLGFSIGDEYVQVKSSNKPWVWSKLAKPITSFLETSRHNPTVRYVLAVDFPLKSDVKQLANYENLSPRNKTQIKGKFEKLCRRAGASPDEANWLLTNLTIVSLPEDQILTQLLQAIVQAYDLTSEFANMYLYVLVGKFLEWAKDRATLTRHDLDEITIRLGEYSAKEDAFKAYGQGLITKVDWEPDKSVSDFFEGKGTRPGHIAANVDVSRPSWLELIDKATMASRVCVLRSSSGQGKSALLYRYAFENWPAENTFILRIAGSPEQVEMVNSYFRYRADIGFTDFLLIDNAGWRTRFWPEISRECAALGIRVLVTVRHEDWFRFAKGSLTNFEILEPILDLDEARQIFEAFESEDRLHQSTDSAEWAYERIGEPHLLMEYVYLLTHGRMLEERLRDQVKQFAEQDEDPKKVEILRRVSLANSLGAPVLADKLVEDVPLRDDAQQVLQSLSDEYIKLESGIVAELHWVRSDHLARLLHEHYPNPARTALTLLDVIPPEYVPGMISNAMCWPGLDSEVFLSGLVDRSKKASIALVVDFLDGLFEAGERNFFSAQQGLFDEAYELAGAGGVLALTTEFLPGTKLNVIDPMIDLLKEKADNFAKIKKIASTAKPVSRGVDVCTTFLKRSVSHLLLRSGLDSFGKLGRLLDWCAFCDVYLPRWSDLKNLFLTDDLLKLPLDSFCSFTFGLFRHDENEYKRWFELHKDDIIGYLKLHTNSIELDISNDILSIKYLPLFDENMNLYGETMYRLEKLRSAIPFCIKYQSQADWSFMDLQPSIDDTFKDIPKENLPYQADIEKNIVWRDVVENYFLPDSFYRYQEVWFNLRNQSLQFIQRFSKWLRKTLEDRKSTKKEMLNGFLQFASLSDLLKYRPKPPTQARPELKDAFEDGASSWASSFSNFYLQLQETIFHSDSELSQGRLARHNFLDAKKHLPKMHQAFEILFEVTADYFDASSLNNKELQAYTQLDDLLYAWMVKPPDARYRNIMAYVKRSRESQRRQLRDLFESLAAICEKLGVGIIIPRDLFYDHPIKYLPLAFSVHDPCFHDKELSVVLVILSEMVKDVKITDFFCIIPVYKGRRFMGGGYRLSSDTIRGLIDGQDIRHWESLVPHELPEKVIDLLPEIPLNPIDRFELQAGINGLLLNWKLLNTVIQKIVPLQIAGNRFERELFERYLEKVSRMVLDLLPVAKRMESLVESLYSKIDYKTIYQIISKFTAGFVKESTVGFDEFKLFVEAVQSEEIEFCLNQLLLSNKE